MSSKDSRLGQTGISRRLSEARARRRPTRPDPVLLTASGVFATLIVVGFVGPMLWAINPNEIDIVNSLLPPSATHPMGTDDTGRDVFARFIEGARISLLLGTAVVVVGAMLGATIGIVAGVLGGWVDTVTMRIMDTVLAFPSLILAMAITIALGAGLETAAIGVVISSIPWYARVVRSEVLRVKTLPMIESARAIGATPTRIVVHHIVPHVLPLLIVQAASAFGVAVLALAALGFIGLGAQIPTPEWGAMITAGLEFTLTGQWWIGVFPGLGLLLAVTSAGVISDRLGDLLNPRSRGGN